MQSAIRYQLEEMSKRTSESDATRLLALALLDLDRDLQQLSVRLGGHNHPTYVDAVGRTGSRTGTAMD